MRINKNNLAVKKGEKISIFYTLLLLFVLSGVIVFYINNIITINNLISENTQLKEKIKKAVQTNYQYRIEIEKLSSYERIFNLASEKFGMIQSDTAVEKRFNLNIKKSELE